MMIKVDAAAVSALFDFKRCYARAEQIWSEDRYFRNSSFQNTARYCERVMRDMGLAEVESLAQRADGRTAYGEWILPRAWEVRGASLRLESARGRLLADYGETPCCLSMLSASTPPDGVVAELMDVAGRSIDESARGKLLLTDQPARALYEAAARFGALGIITDYFPLYPGIRDSRAQMKGVSRWDNDFALPSNDTGLFAFNLSCENGDMLRETLASGQSVKLCARVDAEEFDGELRVISGALPGRDESAGEILMYAHLYEPGANDNASGCAILLEVIDMLISAVNKRILPAPRRSVRIALGAECAGSTAYMLAHPGRDARLCIVADMVGCETRDRARLGVYHNPLSNWSFLDGLTEAITESFARSEGFEYESRAFSVCTDNILGDPSFEMPTVAIMAQPALSYHSSMDTPDRLDENVMRRNASILFTVLTALLYADETDIDRISALSGAYINKARLKCADDERRALWDSISDKAQRELTMYCAGRRAVPQAHTVCFPPAPDEARVPVRTLTGCLCRQRLIACSGETLNFAWNTKLHLPLFWADGKRTLWEIACLYSYETGESDIMAVYKELTTLFNALSQGAERATDWAR